MIDRVDHFFDTFHEDQHVPGIAYGLVLEGELIHAGGTGTKQTSSERTPDVTTIFRICSMTKSFVAVAMLMLRDDGLLRLDDLVADYVPELEGLQLPTSDSPQISLRDLLTMTGGLPEDDAWADRHMDRSQSWIDDFFRAGLTFATAPGTKFEYSNLGWVALGRAVSNVAGIRVQEFVRRRILSPLGMTSTGWDVPSGPNVAIGHRWRNDCFEEVGPPLSDGDFAPMGGLWSSVEDLARWVGFFTDAFPARDGDAGEILSRASRREMQQPHGMWVPDSEQERDRLLGTGYGYGLMIEHDRRLGSMVGHPGGLPGFGSHMRWLPDRGLGVVALGNATYAPMDRVTLRVLELLNQSGELAPPRDIPGSRDLEVAGEHLLTLFNDWDDELAREAFATNVPLDEDLERRRRQVEDLLAMFGPFEGIDLAPASVTRASFTLRGSKGELKGSFLLSPESPARIQTYEIASKA